MTRLMKFVVLAALTIVMAMVATSCSKMDKVTGPDTSVLQTVPADTNSMPKPITSPAWQTSADYAWWRSLTQAQRDATILQQATNDYNTLSQQQGTSTPYQTLQCKPWAQQEVQRATRGVVWLPSTNSNNSTWAYSPYVAPVGYGPAGVSIEGARAGHIVQMVWNGGPHTTFIHHTDAGGMYWLDSNFHIPFDCRLRIHYIKYSDFYTKCSGYVVYQVIGG